MGLPYLDGFVGIYRPKQAVQLDAIRADRGATEFRGYPPSAIDQLKEELGDQIVVQQTHPKVRALARTAPALSFPPHPNLRLLAQRS